MGFERLDGFTSKASNVEGNLPKPTFNLNQRLNTMFGCHGINQADMTALSGHSTTYNIYFFLFYITMLN